MEGEERKGSDGGNKVSEGVNRGKAGSTEMENKEEKEQ